MSIRRSNNGQTNNNINRGFAVTQTGAIGFSEDAETERFCSALKNNQSMQTQQQMISDLQQKLEKLTTSSTATQNESITNNRDAFARISQGSWPYTASAAMDSGSQLFTGEELKIEGLEIYKKQALQKAMSEMEQSKKVIRSRILQMMLSYTNLKDKFDVGTMTWKDGSELVDKRWIKKNQKTSQLHLEDVFYSVSYLSEKCKKYNSLFKHQTEKKFIVKFDTMRNQMKTKRDDLILKWLNAGILLRANKDVKQMMETIEIVKSSKNGLDAEKVLRDLEEGYVFVNNKLQSLPKGSTLMPFKDSNGTLHQMEIADVKRAMKFYICVKAYEKLTGEVKEYEAKIAVLITETSDSAMGQKSTKQNAAPQSGVGGQAAGSARSGANGQAAGGGNGIFGGKGGYDMETEESEFTAGGYHNEKSHYQNRGMTMHHHRDKKNHHDHDHKHGKHGMGHNHHDDNDEDAEETGFCMCADPIPVRAVNTSSDGFCRCANPVPISTATLSSGEKNAYRQLYGTPKYNAHSHGTRNNRGPHHNTRSRSGGRSKRRFGTKGRNNYSFNEFEDASSHKYLFQGNEFDDYM